MALELEPGSTFAGHRIEALAGRGGMGVVYRATDLTLHRQVALKLIAPALAADPVFRERFAIECRSAAAIDHPHAVPVYRAGEEDGALFVTMRFIEGTDLGELMRSEGRLDPDRAVALVGQVAGALDAAHRRGFVHRDVKPTNILIAARDGGEHAFLTDFGLSKPVAAAADGLTKPGFVMGTADYMAPEHARGADVDGRSDVYALACVLFHALAGAVVFERPSDLEKMWAHLHDPPPSLQTVAPELPSALDDVLCRALAKDRSDRHGSAGEFARDAAEALRHGGETPLRVVVADDSELLRAGVVQVLRDAGLDVVAEAGDGEELLAAVRAHRPDVAVTDIRMPPNHVDEGLRAARAIRSELPETGVLVLSQYAEEAYVAELLGESAEGVGYLLKDRVADPAGFAAAVRQVGHGGSALDPEVVEQMLNRPRTDDPLQALTERERAVLARMAEGHANTTIAAELGISERAVERQISAVFAKLDLPPGGEGHRRVLAVLTYLRA
jgi:DNA-binding NarL/FixJ family response regulator